MRRASGWLLFDASQESWRRFSLIFASLFAGALAVVYALILLVDPYDSGRFPSFGLTGISNGNPRSANVSRGRDAQFNAAIIGNSRGQLLAPARLSGLSGLRFVQLTVPGTGPREQLTTLDWFMKHHDTGTLVLVADDTWCTQDAAPPVVNEFPFWLYGGNFDYAINLLNTQSLSVGYRRVLVALGRTPRTDPAGYWDYEDGHAWNFSPPPERKAEPGATGTAYAFPAVDRLADALKAHADFPLVIVMPPVFITELPRSGSDNAARLGGCKAAFESLAAKRPGTRFVDFLRDQPLAHDPQNFMDTVHYRRNVAELIEADVAKVLATVHAR